MTPLHEIFHLINRKQLIELANVKPFKGKSSFYPQTAEGNCFKTFHKLVFGDLEQATLSKEGISNERKTYHFG